MKAIEITNKEEKERLISNAIHLSELIRDKTLAEKIGTKVYDKLLYTDEPFTEENRKINILDPNAPRLPYKFYDNDLGEHGLIRVHHGQRKLLMNEIEFLLIGLPKIKTKEKTVLYVGAAPGQHHIILQKMFPDVRFILYDGNKFHSDIIKLPKYHFYEKLFTHEDAKNYKKMGKSMLFISDIRRDIKDEEDSKEEDDRKIWEDMTWQKDWVKIIRPVMCMLKFRLTYNKLKRKYLSGDLYLQPWVGKISSELRLITDNYDDEIEYDEDMYDEIVHYHNIVIRRMYYEHDYDCLCHCYDCRTEAYILDKYFKDFQGVTDEKKRKEYVCKLSRFITGLVGVNIDIGLGKSTLNPYYKLKDQYYKFMDQFINPEQTKIKEEARKNKGKKKFGGSTKMPGSMYSILYLDKEEA